MSRARVAPGGLRENGLLISGFARLAGRVTGTGPPAVFTTLGRTRGLFWGWLHFAGRLMPGGRLPRRDTEMVILRVAHRRDCAYEAQHHRRLARRVGLTAAEIQRVTGDAEDSAWTPRQRALLQATDELLDSRDLSDPTWSRLRGHLDERTAVEFLLLVGHYDMLAGTLTTLRLAPDPPR